MTSLHIGLSTCPNDTFLFHGLLTGAVPTPGLELQFELLDIETLNQGLLAGRFDVAKGSYALALSKADQLTVLPVGSALGSGNGPLLLAREEGLLPSPGRHLLAPGEHTTATLLLRLFHRQKLPHMRVEQVLFSTIAPALLAGDCDLGLCIHEGRFTYREQGLVCLEDLGERWESETSELLPLGGLFARRALGGDLLQGLTQALVSSLDYGLTHREEALCSMRQHAQELSDQVLWQHVDLYVNQWTRDLGTAGQRAVRILGERAQAAGLMPPASNLEVWQPKQGA
ncbi:MAG: hypothetical protein CMJ86_10790 [Planctomycetes bacterium]|nr:hypothetical protein [Planctomycetota bacterium]